MIVEIPELWVILGVFLGVMIGLILLGVPIAFSLGATSILIMVLPFGPDFNAVAIATQLFGSMDSFVFLAFPFYILLGRLMNGLGLTETIFDFANSVIGFVRGGIAYVNVVASIIFSGMSGLAIADVAGLGRIEYQAMRDHGYDKDMTLGITASSSIIGPIMPPSVQMIVYAVLAQVSIGAMFIAGVLPALLLGFSIMALAYIQVVRRKMATTKSGFNPRDIARTGVVAAPSLFIPIFIIGGIVTGWVTATEAGAVAVLYAIGLGIFYYREFTTQDLIREARGAMVETFAITFILVNATLYGFVALQVGLPVLITDAILGLTENTTIIMLLMVVSFAVIGTFMEKISAISLLVPILAPAFQPLGIDPIHFGVVMVVTLMMGAMTPPVGGSIYALEKVTDASLEEIISGVLPYYVPVALVCVIVALVPELSTYLPEVLL